jgi:arylsulfatase A-like enzyme
VVDYFDPLPGEARTIAHALNERGYASAFFGKWHLSRRDPAAPLVGEAHARTIVPPEARGGFGFWEGFESGFLLNDPWLHGTRLPEPVQSRGYQSDVLCARAADWLSENRPRPWFAVVSLEAPHPPYDAPAAGIERRTIEPPDNVPAAVRARAVRELTGYYAHLEATDRAIGRLLQSLPPDTIVVLTSVHGDMHGAHGLFRKGWPHEESIRVPLLVRRPGEEARVDAAAVSLVDLPAMTLAWAGGHAWRCPRTYAAVSMPSVVALPDQCDRVWRGVRTPQRKLIVNAGGSPWLYFDLEQDPGELDNLAGEASRAAERADLARWL